MIVGQEYSLEIHEIARDIEIRVSRKYLEDNDIHKIIRDNRGSRSPIFIEDINEVQHAVFPKVVTSFNIQPIIQGW
jgi:HSP90 family molecular chaperone